jgi:hypothetical protein
LNLFRPDKSAVSAVSRIKKRGLSKKVLGSPFVLAGSGSKDSG